MMQTNVAAIVLAGVALALCAGHGRADEDAAGRAPPTPEERRASAESIFKNLDKNRDLRLVGDELPAAAWLDRFDRDGDDEITKKEMLEIVDRGPGYDRLFVTRDPRARANNALAQFDQDKDGKVAKAEYPGDERTFEKADRNRDGFLERRELLRMAHDEIDDLRKRARSPGKYEFLGLFDLNGDRQVVQQEYDGPARTFRRLDENGDGVVDYYEIYPDRRPMEREEAPPQPEDITAQRALDTDEDGRVSRAEFKGTDAAWRRLDRNGDGWITAADAR